uniref:S-adenosylmethionine:tRNA ribosyltransferase-isomerase n=3 Tax=Bacteroidales TaxID=171549 RepID=UPI0035A18FD4
MRTTDIAIADYDYPLPEERIAKHALPQRDACKLLVYKGGRITDAVFSQLADLLPD